LRDRIGDLTDRGGGFAAAVNLTIGLEGDLTTAKLRAGDRGIMVLDMDDLLWGK